jgi:hypothetical protein
MNSNENIACFSDKIIACFSDENIACFSEHALALNCVSPLHCVGLCRLSLLFGCRGVALLDGGPALQAEKLS